MDSKSVGVGGGVSEVEMKDRFKLLPPANLPPADSFASYYCGECGEMDYVDAYAGGGIREFYSDSVEGDIVCEVCRNTRLTKAGWL